MENTCPAVVLLNLLNVFWSLVLKGRGGGEAILWYKPKAPGNMSNGDMGAGGILSGVLGGDGGDFYRFYLLLPDQSNCTLFFFPQRPTSSPMMMKTSLSPFCPRRKRRIHQRKSGTLMALVT